MFGSSSTTRSLASGRCRASVSVSMFCIVTRHAEDNLKARWRWSPFRGDDRPGSESAVPRAPRPPAPAVTVSARRPPVSVAPVGDSGGPRADAELGVNPPDVVLHGLLGEEEAGGDLPVGLPVSDE